MPGSDFIIYRSLWLQYGNWPKGEQDQSQGKRLGYSYSSLEYGRTNYVCKGPDSILDMLGHTISFENIQFCPCSGKTAIADIQVNGHDSVLIKLD